MKIIFSIMAIMLVFMLAPPGQSTPSRINLLLFEEDCEDGDTDGYGNPASPECLHSELDCNDSDPDIHPGAVERCNRVDDDCDGLVPADEIDGDGDGWSICLGDCDDTNLAVNPGMPETPGNGIDDDCDPATPAYPEPANTMAAAYGQSSLIGSGVFNELLVVFGPIVAVFVLRCYRRKKRRWLEDQ